MLTADASWEVEAVEPVRAEIYGELERTDREDRQRSPSHILLRICSWMAVRAVVTLVMAVPMAVTSVRSEAFSSVVQVAVELEILVA